MLHIQSQQQSTTGKNEKGGKRLTSYLPFRRASMLVLCTAYFDYSTLPSFQSIFVCVTFRLNGLVIVCHWLVQEFLYTYNFNSRLSRKFVEVIRIL